METTIAELEMASLLIEASVTFDVCGEEDGSCCLDGWDVDGLTVIDEDGNETVMADVAMSLAIVRAFGGWSGLEDAIESACDHAIEMGIEAAQDYCP